MLELFGAVEVLVGLLEDWLNSEFKASCSLLLAHAVIVKTITATITAAIFFIMFMFLLFLSMIGVLRQK